MKDKPNKHKKKSKKSPWSSLARTVNRINREYKKSKSATYLEKAQMARLKLSIDKLKRELEDSQRSNLVLESKVLDLTNDLAQANLKIVSVTSSLNAILNDLDGGAIN